MNFDVQSLRESYQREFAELPPKRVFVQILMSLIFALGGTALISAAFGHILLIMFATFNVAFGLAVTTDWNPESTLYWLSWVIMVFAGLLAGFARPASLLYPFALLVIVAVTAIKVYKES